MSTQPIPRLTPEQYLKIERAAEFRSEYIEGQMFAMAGGTRNHARVVSNASARIHEQLRGTRCEVVGSDMRVHSAHFGIYVYPDIVVTCGPDRLLDGHKDTLTDATLIVEVLSPSTQNYDRGEKFRFYRSLPSFAEYLLLPQDEIRAEHHVRQENGSWLFREFTRPDDSIELTSIGCRLILASLYERVEFEAGA
jgi:Uma2 family endonuclease